MIDELGVWLIFLLPLASFVLIGMVIRPFFNRYAQLSGVLTILAIGTGFVLSLWALRTVATEGGPIEWPSRSWIEVGEIDISLGTILDPLTATMLVVVTGVSLLVQVYSVAYMKGDPGYSRFFAYMSLFTASMVGLVLASNVIQLYVFWELVGLCSYLLIGFWYQRPAAAAAAKKAFIVTRLGDFGFLLGILYLVSHGGPLDIDAINEAAKGGLLATTVVTWTALGVFAGAIGKSGQFPLHTWLPDAMEGPTPVSALIHAATMVAAGVFLVARFFPLFEASQIAMNVVALVGGFTAVFAASMGLVMNDVKRVLAYSTISQLGYMMLALGVAAMGAAVFHLFTHAFFKALLFLGAGSVNHATGTYDMRYMGGLRRHMPWTYATFLVGGLSLAGIFPLAGFWSKDEILTHAAGHGGGVSTLVFWLALAAVFMTAFYMFRALFMTFEGEFKGGVEAEPDAEDTGHGVHLAESPAAMVVPLVVLGAASVLAGFFVNPPVDLGVVSEHWLTHFLEAETADFSLTVAVGSTLVGLAGIGLAYLMYVSRRVSADTLAGRVAPAHRTLAGRYYFDELYEGYIVARVLYGGVARTLDWADKSLVDGIVRLIGRLSRNLGRGIGQVQTGQLQGYGVVISVGVLAMLGVYLFLR